MSSESKTAFFSYCREDSDFALKLAADLKSAGADVWIDQLDIEPGLPWDRAVEDALNSAARMLVVLSPVSVKSDNVRDEVSFALSRHKRVIPVLYRDCEVPFRIARLQHIDFRPDYAHALKILLRALGATDSPSHPPAAGASGPSVIAVSEVEEIIIAQDHAQRAEAEHAGKQARSEEVRAAADKPARKQKEREQREAELEACQEQSRREQRAAEQARLEEEARQAAEKVRLAREEQARQEAEIRARQEQLRREEQESVARRLEFARVDQEQRQRSAAAPAHASTDRVSTAAPVRVPPAHDPPITRRIRTSGLYIAAAVILVFVIGLTLLLIVRPRKPSMPVETKPAETKPAANASPLSSQPPSGESEKGGTPTETVGALASTGEPGSVTSTGSAPAEGAKIVHPIVKDNPAAAKMPVNVSNLASTASGGPARVQLPADISKGFLVHEVVPSYPPLARQALVHGVVKLKVVINKAGAVEKIQTVSGHPLLVPAAIDAVKQWRYRPFVVDDKPVEVDTIVTIGFDLKK